MLLLIWYEWNHLVRSKSEREGLRKNEERAESLKVVTCVRFYDRLKFTFEMSKRVEFCRKFYN